MTAATKTKTAAAETTGAPVASPTKARETQPADTSVTYQSTLLNQFEDMPEEEMLYDLADLFKVFADTTRIKILFALMNGALCVNDIALLIGSTQTAVSHQLRILKQAHLVKFSRDGKNVFYSLSDDHVYTVLAQGLSHICE